MWSTEWHPWEINEWPSGVWCGRGRSFREIVNFLDQVLLTLLGLLTTETVKVFFWEDTCLGWVMTTIPLSFRVNRLIGSGLRYCFNILIQLGHARLATSHIGIDLSTIPTEGGGNPMKISCLHSKSSVHFPSPYFPQEGSWYPFQLKKQNKPNPVIL